MATRGKECGREVDAGSGKEGEGAIRLTRKLVATR
jgi:hypothetical protein